MRDVMEVLSIRTTIKRTGAANRTPPATEEQSPRSGSLHQHPPSGQDVLTGTQTQEINATRRLASTPFPSVPDHRVIARGQPLVIEGCRHPLSEYAVDLQGRLGGVGQSEPDPGCVPEWIGGVRVECQVS